ncbi:hypothetical protein QQF64_020394 [Cirrhinus molitorella]|uniref:Uncharacterized protein n=1 Tax=Cirrhinus molitorella TaxID=172907 RepID=A0ABR3LCH5_9TELE
MSDEEAQASRENHAHASLPRRGQITPKDIPLPPPFRNDGTESFQLWARRYEVIQEARYKDSSANLDAVLAAELPTRLPPELFIVWDNFPSEIQSSFAAAKKQLQDAFGQKDVIASFQTFPNSRHKLPNEPMEVYAADICRLVKEAFPDFEQNASEYMKLSRFLAGLDQELQIKCHEWGVKTFKEAFQVATQAERARQAARLVQPVSSAVRDYSAVQTVNAISDSDTVVLKQAVTDLTNTVKELSKDVSALKLQLHDQRGRAHRTPSPHRCSPTRYSAPGIASYEHSQTRHSSARSPSPDRYRRSPSRGRDLYRRTKDTYQRNDQVERFQDRNYPPYSTDFCPDYYEDGRRGRWNDSTSYNSSSFQRRSPSPHQKCVTFEDYRDRHQRPQEPNMDLQSGPRGSYRDHYRHHQGNFH